MPKSSQKSAKTGSAGPAHFVPLSVIIDDYKGKLAAYMKQHETSDVVVTMPVEIEVAKQGLQKFFVAVAVTKFFDAAEGLSDEVTRMAPKQHRPLFAWVPAHLYGRNDFSIFIDDAPVGENLKNGLVGEIITAASVEDAVVALALD